MKRVFSAVAALIFALAICPSALAYSSETIYPVRNAYFNSTSEWATTDSTTGGDNLLVAACSGTDWNAPTTFTDLDGSTTTTNSLQGSGFGTPRHAVITFALPSHTDIDTLGKVTLKVTVKNVKQVSSGARLAVYGNSLRSEWSMDDGKEIFGVTGSSAGLENLPLLGLTDAISAGSWNSQVDSNQTINLSSLALTDYVKGLMREGYAEATFRFAAPLGGIRLYDMNTSYPPSLTFEYGSISTVTIQNVLMDGETVVDTQVKEVIENRFVGTEFTYAGPPENYVTYGSDICIYDENASTLKTTVKDDGSSVITLVYRKYDTQNTYEGHLVAEGGAWNWVHDPGSLHYENEEGTINSTYIGYIDVHGAVKATQYNFLTNEVSEVLIRSNLQPDDHNNPTFLILPDERVMVFYTRHTDEPCIWYRVSKEPGDITTLGEEKKLVTDHNTTYPCPFILSDDPDHIYLCWRGINWHPTIAKIDIPDENGDTQFAWGPYQMVQSTGARPYPEYASNGKDKIYFAYTTGHPDNENPNWVYFNYININERTLEDVQGNTLSHIENGPFYVNKSTYDINYVVDNTQNIRNWLWQVVIDDDGAPVIAMVAINAEKTSHDYYYVKWTGTEWRKTYLANGGGHFHQTPNLEMCYSGGMAIDPANPNIVYCSVPIQGAFGKVYEIVKYTIDENGNVASTEQITKNSRKNNVRMYVVRGSENSDLRLVWMYGDYYDWIVSMERPVPFPTSVHCDMPLPTGEIDLEDGRSVNYDFEDDKVGGTAYIEKGVLVSSENTSAVIDTESANEFTVSITPYLNHYNYGGKIIDFGSASYGVDKSTIKPYVKIGDTVYHSSNVFANSDCWQRFTRGTTGQYGSEYYKYVNLTFTYDGSHLKVYIGGLLDQNIEAEGLSLGDITIGGFDGWVEDLYVYSRALSQAEVKEICKNTENYELDDEFLIRADLEAIKIPPTVTTHIVLPTSSNSGNAITWTSSDPSILGTDGIVKFPETPTEVTLTADISGHKKDIKVTVLPRNIENNKVLAYEFESKDVYEKDGIVYVKDRSGNGNDAAIYGNAQVNGVLDLTANTADGWATNGYAMAPSGVLKGLRSYTFIAKVKLSNNNGKPRIYDFGTDQNNSVFCRANPFAAGMKVKGATTLWQDSPTQLPVGTECVVAVVYDASTKITTIYVDGAVYASGTNINTEPYQVAGNERNYIGRTQWWQAYPADNYDLCGTIDGFYMYNTALTVDEIASVYEGVTAKCTMSGNTVSVTVTNGTKSDISDVKIYAAVYSSNKMKSVKSGIIDNIPAGGSGDVALSVSATDTDTVKVFVWNDKLSPYTEYIKVK